MGNPFITPKSLSFKSPFRAVFLNLGSFDHLDLTSLCRGDCPGHYRTLLSTCVKQMSVIRSPPPTTLPVVTATSVPTDGQQRRGGEIAPGLKGPLQGLRRLTVPAWSPVPIPSALIGPLPAFRITAPPSLSLPTVTPELWTIFTLFNREQRNCKTEKHKMTSVLLLWFLSVFLCLHALQK